VAAAEARLSRIDDRARLVLALVALAGPDVAFREIYLAVSQAIDPTMSEPDLLNILDGALGAGMLSERGLGYSFRYPLFRAALSNRLSRQRRARFHTAIAHAIEECRPSEVELLAYHYGRNDDREHGAIYLQRAVERARAAGLQETEENHLWRLLERLHVLGRTDDAEEVKETLRALIQSIDRGVMLPPQELQRQVSQHYA
jgi:DNA-binding Lrp family transcriptional regulator